MKKLLLIFLFSVCCANFGNSQNSIWKTTSIERTSILEKTERDNVPSQYLLYNLNFNSFKALVETAPRDNSGEVSNVIISFPNPKGLLENYIVYEAPVMEDGLSNKFPSVKSYVAKGLKDKTATMRFSTTLFGLHAMLTSGDEGTFYIDTYTKDLNNYIVYNKKSLNKTRTFTCFNQDDTEVTAGKLLETQTSTYVNDGLFRQYRLAMACTIEYAAFHVNAANLNGGTLLQKKAAVLSAMVVTMTRVNGIYERDMSLRMNLVANNDLVIFVDADTFDNNNANTLINQSQSIIDTNIGNANYDIGHTVSTGGGGLAGLGVVCNNTQKARGITGSPSPVGDPYDIDYVAHEVGHQFGGSHTFNNSCNGNRSASTSAEPGSGSTIMAYAGICAPNVQGNSDDYFHAISIAQMTAKVLSTSCAAVTPNGNSAPILSPLTSYTIPIGTPFSLTASATDANNDALTYCWEQTDTAISTQSPLPTSTTGPNFRSLTPVSSSTRYFPSIASLISGFPSTWEVLPTVARSMNFAVTVRDNRTPNGGQTNRANTSVTFTNVGPFDVTSQNTDQLIWAPGSSQTITWTVNNTTSLVGSANVNILLSTDNGQTFTTTLASNVPNNGSYAITVPSIDAAYCRVMVKPTGNIYFDINSKNIAIGNVAYQAQNACVDYPYTFNAAIPESATSYSGYSLPISDSFTVTDVKVTLNVTHPNITNLQFGISSPTGYAVTPTPVISRLYRTNFSCTAGGVNLSKVFDMAGAAINCANSTDGALTLPSDSISTTNYIGTNSAGTWYIWFVDTNTTDGLTGTIDNMTLTLCKSEFVPVVLANETFGLTDFALYPNPNNGSFTVQFSSESSNDVNVTIHDLRGREVYAKSYQNSGLFNQELNINNASSGIYLVTVQDGNRKEVKKIVVE